MKIAAYGLTLELTPVNQLDDADWCRVGVVAAVPGFMADFVAYLQGADLHKLRREIDAMYKSVGQPGEAVLSSAEPGITIKLSMQTLGGVEGTYELRSEFAQPGAPCLAGRFEIDQSFLPLLSSEIEQLLAKLEGA